MGGSRDGAEPPTAIPSGPLRSGTRRHNRLLPARPGDSVDWPDWVSAEVRAAWRRQGVERPWRHQVEAADAAHAGRHVVITTGTASGKSLGYLLPILAATAPGPASSAAPGPAPFAAPSPPRGAVTGPAGQDSLFDTPDADTPDDAATVTSPTAGPALDPAANPWRRRTHTALYLAPTKALAHDQLRRCTALGVDRWRVATVDGDTPPDEREWARDYASLVLTNPDLLHHALLPQHARWRGLLQSLRYVVVDEAHRYRGVFGAQVAAVLRRLRRLAAHYGASPTFVLASATAGDAVRSAAALTGVAAEEFVLVDRDASVRGPIDVELWQPDDSADTLTAELLTTDVAADRQVIAFVASRRASETIALDAQAALARRGVVPARVEAYRGGYLASDRRRIEDDLQSGRLRAVAATNALELGVDIAGVDSVIICGYPGSRAALWQQAGRAGRRGNSATVRLVARRNPLDAYLLDHPDALFDGSQEVTALHPENPHVLAPQLAAAAQELPLTDADRSYFGAVGLELAARLAAGGQLRRRPGGYYWTRPERAAASIDLRAADGEAVDIIEEDTGRVLGYVDASTADRVVHPGAVYLHLGETYLCDDWLPGDREVFVRAARPGYLTQPQERSHVQIVAERERRVVGRGHLHLGEVEVTAQVTAYLRRDAATGQVWDSTPLDLPERRHRTTAVWWTLEADQLVDGLEPRSPGTERIAAAELRASPARLDAAAHAAEHVCVGLLPVFAPCDRWDIGGHSDPEHQSTGAVTVFVHDAQAGGTGFAERAYAVAADWLGAVYERLRDCDCDLGCPRCILTGCGSSRALGRAGATVLLRQLVT